MGYIYNTLNIERLRYLLRQKGMTERAFSKALWGDGTHLNIKYFAQKPDVKCSTLIKICNILGVSVESIFAPMDDKDNVPSIVGNDNIINSAIIGSDISRLKHENDTLKLVLKEKDARIDDLKNINSKLEDRLDLIIKMGRFSDK